MPKNLRFWGNVGLIAIAHILLIVGLIRWSRESKNASAQSVVWLNGGAGDGVVTEKKNLSAPMKSPSPRKESKTDSPKFNCQRLRRNHHQEPRRRAVLSPVP
jgi:hypothetical protein